MMGDLHDARLPVDVDGQGLAETRQSAGGEADVDHRAGDRGDRAGADLFVWFGHGVTSQITCVVGRQESHASPRLRRRAFEPALISIISRVIAAWRRAWYCCRSEESISSAFFPAVCMAVMRASCSEQ